MHDEDRALSQRQERERAFHAEYASRNREKITTPVLLDVVGPGPRRPWNGYWTSYDLMMARVLAGKRVMVPGCGFGEDPIRLAALGAIVHASDLSVDLLEIARLRAARMGVTCINFAVMPAESLAYPNDFFDVLFFNDILHHVDIQAAIEEARRVARHGAFVVVNELYTHSAMQKIRESPIIAKLLYPMMLRRVYGTTTPYITEDEHKINQHELALVETILQPGSQRLFFSLLSGRITQSYHYRAAKFDRAVLRRLGSLGRFVAGRVVLAGTIRK